METASTAALILLGLVVFVNLRAGTLGQWARAKFLNDGAPTPASYTAAGALAAGQAGAANAGQFTGSVAGLAGGGGTAGLPLGTSGRRSPATSGWSAPLASLQVTQPYGGDHGGHPGIDLAAPTHTAAYAAKAGTVTQAGDALDGYGNAVVIDHGNGWSSRYGHGESVTVRVGQKVTQGQQVLWTNNTGYSHGPHLHFEIRYHGTTVDPGPLIGAGS